MRLPEVSLSESMPRLPSSAVMSVASNFDFSLRASAPKAKPAAPPAIWNSSLLTLKSMKLTWALPISVGSLTWAASIAAWPAGGLRTERIDDAVEDARLRSVRR